MKKLINYLPLVTAIVIGLTPIIWFLGRGGYLINGVDTNFPLNPTVWFTRRFYVWNATLNAGADFASSTAGIFFHLLQFLPYSLGFHLQLVQLVSLLFWFLVITLSSYLYIQQVVPSKKLAQIAFVTFYSLNTYLFNTWENVKVANLALVAAIPLALWLFELLHQKKISRFTASVFLLAIGMVLSGTGINPSYFIAFFVALTIYATASIVNLSKRSDVKSLVYDVLQIATVLVLVNFYWILPTLKFILGSISATNSIGDIGFTNWVDSLSENTSILNIMRLQGAWDWYARDSATGMPLYIPYALNYFRRLPFVLFSLMLPFVAIVSFLFKTKDTHRFYLAFGVLSILGIFLGAGTHPPTGILFRLMLIHIPFFSLFRSPWYIFTPYLTLAYAGLTALFIANSDENIKRFSKALAVGLRLLIVAYIVGNLIYTYPLLTGKIFRPNRDDTFFVSFPAYISQAEEYLQDAPEGRILSYPGDEIEQFSWKYRGIESILGLFADREVFFSPLNGSNLPQAKSVQELYRHLYRGEKEGFYNLAGKLGVRYIFEKKDQQSLALQLPSWVLDLESNTFGQWVFYKLPDERYFGKIYEPNRYYFVHPYEKNIEGLSFVSAQSALVSPSDSVYLNNKESILRTGHVVLSENSHLELDASSPKEAGEKLSQVSYTFSIPEDGIYSPILESFGIEAFGLDIEGEVNVSVDSVPMPIAIRKATDSYLYFDELVFTKGEHTLSITIDNPNLVDGDFSSLEQLTREGEGDFEIIGEDGGSVLSITNSGQKDISANIFVSGFSPLFSYYIASDYKHVYGYEATVLATQYRANGLLKTQIEKMPSVPEWRRQGFIYQPVVSDSQLKLQLAAKWSDSPIGTKVLYDNVEVRRLFSNQMAFVKEPIISESREGTISITQSNPVSYAGYTNNTSSIVFAESYEPGWSLAISGQELPHFSVNAFMNGWYVDARKETANYRIFYSPQRYYLFGWLVSLISAGVVIGLYVWKRYH